MIKTFKEAIIDIPRKTYAPGVFDEADTSNPKIKKSVKALIDKQIAEFEKEYPVVKIGLVGSILTKRYRNDADLDFNVLFDVPKDKREDERIRLSKQFLSASNPDSIQGKLIPGTKHPINYYLITDMKIYQDQEDKADAVFDIENNKFTKRPEDYTFDMSLYLKDFQKKVDEIDVVKGELKRDIIDYDELKELKPNDILDLQGKINDKLEEIETDIEDIIKIGDTVDAERRAAFDTDMTPDEIKTFSIKNRLPKNVVYKMLEKYHYLKFWKKCKKILDDGEVTDAEIDSLKTESKSGDELEHLKLMNKALKTFAGSPKQKDIIKQLNVVRKRLGLKPLKESVELDEFSMRDLKRWTTDRQRIKGALAYWKQKNYKIDQHQIAQWFGIDYREFDDAVRAAGLKEEFLKEARRKSMAFTFGRFNPPTIGHEKLINKVASVRADDYKIYLSRSEDAKKNPLGVNEKLRIMKKMFPRHARHIEINTTNMILDICTKLYKQGVTEIFMVVGSDRVREFETIINKYNDIKSRHGHYKFDNVNVLSAGERDPDAEGASGMSASKMRAAAAKGDMNSFKRGLPRGVNADEIMKAVRQGMQLAANYIYMRKAKPIASLNEFEQQQVRDLYIREQIFNVNDKVNYVKEDIKGKVVRKGTNYIVVEDSNNNLHKAWIWDCIPISADRDIEMHEHNLDVDYGFTAVESTDIGQDYAKHTSTITPGEPSFEGSEQPSYKPAKEGSGEQVAKPYKRVKGFLDREREKSDLSKEDVKEWAIDEDTVSKYKEKYKETWKSKLKEVVNKMMDKIK